MKTRSAYQASNVWNSTNGTIGHEPKYERILKFLPDLDAKWQLWKPDDACSSQACLRLVTYAMFTKRIPHCVHRGMPFLPSHTIILPPSFQTTIISIFGPHARIRGGRGCRFRGLDPWRCGWWTRRSVSDSLFLSNFVIMAARGLLEWYRPWIRRGPG
jgi:hypothetical protein